MDVPPSRTWVYYPGIANAGGGAAAAGGEAAAVAAEGGVAAEEDAASSCAQGGIVNLTSSLTEEGYELYLNCRVQRPVARSLPDSYSYFTSNAGGEGGVAKTPEGGLKSEEGEVR